LIKFGGETSYTAVKTIRDDTNHLKTKLPDGDGNSGKWLSSDYTWKEITFDHTSINNQLTVLGNTTSSLQTQIDAIPASQTIPEIPIPTQSNKFVITSLAGDNGSLSYITPTTSLIDEGTNLYFTATRCNNAIDVKIGDGSITNAVLGQVQAQTLIALSDIRLKENIKKIVKNSVLDKLQPVEYNFKDDTIKRKRYGLIAQDVEEVYPELIHQRDDGIKGINYQDIIALLIKDNLELNKRISNLEKLLKI
jgi:hypothetical protein